MEQAIDIAANKTLL